MRMLVLMVIGLLVAGNAAAGKDRWERGGYQSSKASYGEMKRSWGKSAREFRSSRLNYLRASNLNSGVCDVLEGSSRSLRMMCIAFCELQSCSPDFTADNPFESCSRSSKWIYNRYEQKRGAGDPEMPCVSQSPVVQTTVAAAACPCWSTAEYSQLRYAAAGDTTRCAVDGVSGTSTNVDYLVISGGAPYTLSMTSFGSYQGGTPSCSLYDACTDGSCLVNDTRLMEVSPEQLVACETDIANAALARGVACN